MAIIGNWDDQTWNLHSQGSGNVGFKIKLSFVGQYSRLYLWAEYEWDSQGHLVSITPITVFPDQLGLATPYGQTITHTYTPSDWNTHLQPRTIPGRGPTISNLPHWLGTGSYYSGSLADPPQWHRAFGRVAFDTRGHLVVGFARDRYHMHQSTRPLGSDYYQIKTPGCNFVTQYSLEFDDGAGNYANGIFGFDPFIRVARKNWALPMPARLWFDSQGHLILAHPGRPVSIRASAPLLPDSFGEPADPGGIAGTVLRTANDGQTLITPSSSLISTFRVYLDKADDPKLYVPYAILIRWRILPGSSGKRYLFFRMYNGDVENGTTTGGYMAPGVTIPSFGVFADNGISTSFYLNFRDGSEGAWAWSVYGIQQTARTVFDSSGTWPLDWDNLGFLVHIIGGEVEIDTIKLVTSVPPDWEPPIP